MRPNYQSRVATNELPRELTREEYEALLSSETLRALVDDVKNNGDWRLDSEDKDEARVAKMYHEAAVKRAKEQAPVIMYNAGFRDGDKPAKRDNRYAVPTGLVMLDFDHIGDPRAFYAAHDWKADGLRPALIAPSISGEGLRAVYEIPEAVYTLCKNFHDIIWTAQQYIADKVGVSDFIDASCKDWARCAFATPLEDAFLYDPEVMFNEELRMKNEEFATASDPFSPLGLHENSSLLIPNSSFTYEGIPIADIIAEYWKAEGGEPHEGNRNSSLFKLALELRPLTGNDMDTLKAVIPSYGLDESELDSVIKSACKYEKNKPSYEMTKILNRLKAEHSQDELKRTMLSLPLCPEKLPRFLELACMGVPADQRGCVAMAALSVAMSYVHDVRVYYPSGKFKEPVLLTCIVGLSSDGKSVIDEPMDRVMAIIDERDRAANEQIKTWQEATKGLASTKDKPKKPHVRRQRVRKRVTEAAFLEWLEAAAPYKLTLIAKELRYLNRAAGGDSGSNKDGIGLINAAFDLDTWGASRVTADAIDSDAIIRVAMVAAVQPNVLVRYFRGNHQNGASSRVCLVTLPPQGVQPLLEMPAWTEEQQAEMDRFMNVLDSCKGDFRVETLCNFYRDEMEPHTLSTANINADIPAYNHFRKRSMEMTFYAGFILYLLEGGTFTDEIAAFMTWLLDMDMGSKMAYFATPFQEEALAGDVRPVKPSDIFTLLPQKFSSTDVRNAFTKNGIKSDYGKAIENWLSRGKIISDSRGQYRKV